MFLSFFTTATSVECNILMYVLYLNDFVLIAGATFALMVADFFVVIFTLK